MIMNSKEVVTSFSSVKLKYGQTGWFSNSPCSLQYDVFQEEENKDWGSYLENDENGLMVFETKNGEKITAHYFYPFEKIEKTTFVGLKELEEAKGEEIFDSNYHTRIEIEKAIEIVDQYLKSKGFKTKNNSVLMYLISKKEEK